jgi:ATP-dependent DNA ligase
VTLPIAPPLEPMLALLVGEIPEGPEWQYEPKWDGFRCLAFKDGEEVELQSKAGQSLTRYFPELVDTLRASSAPRCVLDGEIVIPMEDGLSFDDLLQRIHPAESRVRRLAQETPALYIVFDLLVDAEGRSLLARPLAERRDELERFAAAHLGSLPGLRLSPVTRDAAVARRWLASAGGALDGILAKRLDVEYRAGDRTGMQKIKLVKTADCVVGGFRYAAKGKVLGSLLLGLYDEAGRLDHVGFCSGIKEALRKEWTAKVEARVQEPGFTGRTPGGPSRWSTERTGEWVPLAPTLVVEVSYDHFSQGRFRHGTRFLRWRPDKAPRDCTLAQVRQEGRVSGLALLSGLEEGSSGSPAAPSADRGRAARAAPGEPRSPERGARRKGGSSRSASPKRRPPAARR